MKKILLLTSAITLLATSGCLVSDGRHEGFRDEDRHEHVEHHEDVVVPAPAVDVRPPEVIVH